MTRILRKVIFACFFIASINVFFLDNLFAAGPPGPPGGGGDPPCWPSPCVPIDGGIGFLLAAGLAYGSKKAFDAYKKKK